MSTVYYTDAVLDYSDKAAMLCSRQKRVKQMASKSRGNEAHQSKH